ncbi:MAG TPA: hypothetical protein VMS64_23605 [Candidatus Methylomirabilis sp.]|nr:hypothetical protein [Candidatus Methylomirabilis sp.]
MTRRRSFGLAGVVGILTLLLGDCASTRPTPVTSIDPLVGKWAGTVAPEGGSQVFFYLTVNQDRTIVANWGISWATGTITVANGQVTYKMTPPPYEGTIEYYQSSSGGRPTIYMTDTFASFYAVATKQQ